MYELKLNEQRFKEMNHRLIGALKSSGIRVPHQSGLQALSQAIFGKPYEEAQKTSLLGFDNKAAVIIIKYAEQQILALNGQYVCALNPGTDCEIPYHAFQSQATALAKLHQVDLKEVELPPIYLGDNNSDDDIVEWAVKMGYGQNRPSIFDMFDHGFSIFIDGMHSPFDLNSDWKELLANTDPCEQVIWMPETKDFDDIPYEFFFTFGDLCNAIPRDEECRMWVVAGMGKTHNLTFKS